MSWQEAKKRYENGDTLAKQQTEDLVARRVLRGLGFVERQLFDIEKALDLRDRGDMALWPRTFDVMQLMLARRGWLGEIFGTIGKTEATYSVEVQESDPQHKPILELLPLFAAHKNAPHPMYMTRVKGTKLSLTYYLVSAMFYGPEGSREADMYALLTPPVNVIAAAGIHWWLVAQETEHFISQFGPFKSPLEENT